MLQAFHSKEIDRNKMVPYDILIKLSIKLEIIVAVDGDGVLIAHE